VFFSSLDGELLPWRFNVHLQYTLHVSLCCRLAFCLQPHLCKEVSKRVLVSARKQLVTVRHDRLQPKRMSFRRLLEISVVHVLSEVLQQGVPHTRISSRESRRCRNCCVCAERRRRGTKLTAMSWMSEARYAGVCPDNDWCTRHASLNSTYESTYFHHTAA